MINCNKELFLEKGNFSDSIVKAYLVVFKKIKELEEQLGKDAKDFNLLELHVMLKCLSSKSYHSINVKWCLMKNYIKYYGNSYPDRITQDDIKLYIDTEENENRYISRKDLEKAVNNLENPQDRVMLLLLFEGVYDSTCKQLLNLRVDQINTKDKEIYLEDRTIKISDFTNEEIKVSLKTSLFYKLGNCGDYPLSSEVYKLNTDSPYIIRTKPSKRTKDGMSPLGFEGFKSRMQKLSDEIGLPFSSLTLYHSGLFEKVLEKETIKYKRKNELLTLSEIKTILYDNGVKKVQISAFKKAYDGYKRKYKINLG